MASVRDQGAAVQELREVNQSLVAMTELQRTLQTRSPQRSRLMQAVHQRLAQRLRSTAASNVLLHAGDGGFASSPRRSGATAGLDIFPPALQQQQESLLAGPQDVSAEWQAIGQSVQAVRTLLEEIAGMATMQGTQVEHIVGQLERAQRDSTRASRQVHRRWERERVNTHLLALLSVPAVVTCIYVLKIVYHSH